MRAAERERRDHHRQHPSVVDKAASRVYAERHGYYTSRRYLLERICYCYYIYQRKCEHDELAENEQGRWVDVLSEDEDGAKRDGEIDRAEVLYMHFISTSRQLFTREQLLPVSYESIAEQMDARAAAEPCLFEPDANTIFNSVLPLHLRAMMQEIYTESAASEQASRVMAMQTASDNAKELLDELNLEYNKLRQQSITTELLDIIGGQVQR